MKMISIFLLLVLLFASQLIAVANGSPKKSPSVLQREDVVGLYRFEALATELEEQYNSVNCNNILQCICSVMKQDVVKQSLCLRQGPLLSKQTISHIEHIYDISVQLSNEEEELKYWLSNRKLLLRKALLFDCYLSKRQDWSRQNLNHKMPSTHNTRDIVVEAMYENRKKPPKLELRMKSAVSIWFDKYRSRTSWRVRLVDSGNRALLPQDISVPILSNTKQVHELIKANLPTTSSSFSLCYHQGSTYVELPCDEETTLLHCGLVPPNIKLVLNLKPAFGEDPPNSLEISAKSCKTFSSQFK